jgi:hypothetical protein
MVNVIWHRIRKLFEEWDVLTNSTSKEHTIVLYQLVLIIWGRQDVVKCEAKQLTIARLDL